MRIYYGPAREWFADAPDAVLVTIDVEADGVYQQIEYADGTTSERIHVGGREGVEPRLLRLLDDAQAAAA